MEGQMFCLQQRGAGGLPWRPSVDAIMDKWMGVPATVLQSSSKSLTAKIGLKKVLTKKRIMQTKNS